MTTFNDDAGKLTTYVHEYKRIPKPKNRVGLMRHQLASWSENGLKFTDWYQFEEDGSFVLSIIHSITRRMNDVTVSGIFVVTDRGLGFRFDTIEVNRVLGETNEMNWSLYIERLLHTFMNLCTEITGLNVNKVVFRNPPDIFEDFFGLPFSIEQGDLIIYEALRIKPNQRKRQDILPILTDGSLLTKANVHEKPVEETTGWGKTVQTLLLRGAIGMVIGGGFENLPFTNDTNWLIRVIAGSLGPDVIMYSVQNPLPAVASTLTYLLVSGRVYLSTKFYVTWGSIQLFGTVGPTYGALLNLLPDYWNGLKTFAEVSPLGKTVIFDSYAAYEQATSAFSYAQSSIREYVPSRVSSMVSSIPVAVAASDTTFTNYVNTMDTMLNPWVPIVKGMEYIMSPTFQNVQNWGYCTVEPQTSYEYEDIMKGIVNHLEYCPQYFPSEIDPVYYRNLMLSSAPIQGTVLVGNELLTPLQPLHTLKYWGYDVPIYTTSTLTIAPVLVVFLLSFAVQTGLNMYKPQLRSSLYAFIFGAMFGAYLLHDNPYMNAHLNEQFRLGDIGKIESMLLKTIPQLQNYVPAGYWFTDILRKGLTYVPLADIVRQDNGYVSGDILLSVYGGLLAFSLKKQVDYVRTSLVSDQKDYISLDRHVIIGVGSAIGSYMLSNPLSGFIAAYPVISMMVAVMPTNFGQRLRVRVTRRNQFMIMSGIFSGLVGSISRLPGTVVDILHTPYPYYDYAAISLLGLSIYHARYIPGVFYKVANQPYVSTRLNEGLVSMGNQVNVVVKDRRVQGLSMLGWMSSAYMMNLGYGEFPLVDPSNYGLVIYLSVIGTNVVAGHRTLMFMYDQVEQKSDTFVRLVDSYTTSKPKPSTKSLLETVHGNNMLTDEL